MCCFTAKDAVWVPQRAVGRETSEEPVPLRNGFSMDPDAELCAVVLLFPAGCDDLCV